MTRLIFSFLDNGHNVLVILSQKKTVRKKKKPPLLFFFSLFSPYQNVVFSDALRLMSDTRAPHESVLHLLQQTLEERKKKSGQQKNRSTKK